MIDAGEVKLRRGVTEKVADEALIKVWTIIADSDINFDLISALHEACKKRLTAALRRHAHASEAYSDAGLIKENWTDDKLEK